MNGWLIAAIAGGVVIFSTLRYVRYAADHHIYPPQWVRIVVAALALSGLGAFIVGLAGATYPG